MRYLNVMLLAVTFLSGACLPEPEPVIDQATVLSNNSSVRMDATAASRTLFRLSEGERISIIEKRGNWYRIRDKDRIEGWMDESTIITDQTADAMRVSLTESEGQPVQNTARTREEVYLRLDPGRDTRIIRRLRRETEVQILDRSTTPRPDSDATDIWFKVRTSPDEIGWVYSQLVDIDTPEPLLGFTEGRTYVAVQQLRQVQDPEFGAVNWYVVAERRADTEPGIAFDGIRVFVWNLAEHQFETTLRLRNLRGMFPLELTGDTERPGFRFPVEGADGQSHTREFVMRQTLPREVAN